MSKRMQVLIPDHEYRDILKTTKRLGVSVADWIRELVRRGLEETRGASPDDRISKILHFAKYTGPSGDIEEILEQIESGRDMK